MPAGLRRHTRCSCLLAALLLFMRLLQSKQNLLSARPVFTIQRNNTATYLWRQCFSYTSPLEHTPCRRPHWVFKTLELHVLLIRLAVSLQIRTRSRLSASSRELPVSHIFIDPLNITGIWCMSSDWQMIFFPSPLLCRLSLDLLLATTFTPHITV